VTRAFPEARVFGAAAPVADGAIAGRLRAVDRRLRNDAGWFSCRCVSDLPALGFVLHGRGDEVWRRFDRYKKAGKTMVRVLGMLAADSWVSAGLDFSPRTPGYADARELLVAQANARGMYVKLDLFADAQIAVPSAAERRAMVVEQFVPFCVSHPGVFPGLANEPYKNGWTSATDPELLALAEDFAAAVGHRDFTIGDVGDDDAEASPEIAAKMAEVARHCNVVAWHPSRSFDLNDKRWRRYLDHLEGVTDLISQWRPGVALFVEEPIGAALQAVPGRRDNDPDAFVAAHFISLLCGFAAYTYHWPGELDVDQLPGFLEAIDVEGHACRRHRSGATSMTRGRARRPTASSGAARKARCAALYVGTKRGRSPTARATSTA
jgi:hypothetical protein